MAVYVLEHRYFRLRTCERDWKRVSVKAGLWTVDWVCGPKLTHSDTAVTAQLSRFRLLLLLLLLIIIIIISVLLFH